MELYWEYGSNRYILAKNWVDLAINLQNKFINNF